MGHTITENSDNELYVCFGLFVDKPVGLKQLPKVMSVCPRCGCRGRHRVQVCLLCILANSGSEPGNVKTGFATVVDLGRPDSRVCGNNKRMIQWDQDLGEAMLAPHLRDTRPA
jgi:hypothetical protein